MLAIEIMKDYKKLKYLATDGKMYYLCGAYPICMKAKEEEVVYLDTGGPMQGCKFLMAKIQEGRK